MLGVGLGDLRLTPAGYHASYAAADVSWLSPFPGGSPLLPKAATFLPGGCYVSVAKASDGALQVDAGRRLPG